MLAEVQFTPQDAGRTSPGSSHSKSRPPRSRRNGAAIGQEAIYVESCSQLREIVALLGTNFASKWCNRFYHYGRSDGYKRHNS